MASPLEGGDDLDKAFRALMLFSDIAPKVSEESIRKRVRPVVTKARAQYRSVRMPADPSSDGWITFRLVRDGAEIVGSGPRADYAEWGGWTVKVFGETVNQANMKRFIHGPWSREGRAITPTVQATAAQVHRQVADDMMRESSRQLDKAGVKRG